MAIFIQTIVFDTAMCLRYLSFIILADKPKILLESEILTKEKVSAEDSRDSTSKVGKERVANKVFTTTDTNRT